MGILRLRLAYDPTTLLEAAAEGFVRPPASAPMASGVGAPPRAGAPSGGAQTAGPPGSRARGATTFPTPPYLLALRQGGIRDDLLDLAARRGVPGWFDPPLCTFQELPERLGVGPRRPLGAFERVALIGELVQGVGGEVLARLRRPEAYLAALDRFFGELAAESVLPEALEAAQARSGERDAFAVRRDREVAAVYRAYVEALERAGRRDGRDWLADCAATVRSDPQGLARRLGGRREIRLLGLQDLRGGWRALLSALRDSPAVDELAIYTSVPLDLVQLGAVSERLPEGETLAGRLFTAAGGGHSPGAASPERTDSYSGAARLDSDSAPARHLQGDLFDAGVSSGGEPPGSGSQTRGSAGADDDGRARWPVRVIVAPDAQREVEEVARRVRELVDEGVAPNRIAVVAREARPQLAMAVAALRRFGLPVTARERTGLAEVPVVRAVLSLLDVAADGWSRHGLVELADQPYLGVELDAGVVNTVGYRERVTGLPGWDEALARLLGEAQARERAEQAGAGDGERDGHARPLPPAWRVERTRTQLHALRERVGELDEPRPLRAWVAWLGGVLAEDRWGLERRAYQAPAERTDIVRLDLAGLKALAAIAAEWAEALEVWGGERDGDSPRAGERADEPLDVGAFAARLRDELDADVALWTETRRGVQVLEGLAAAYRGFEHVFVVGLEAGRFPRAPGRSPLLDAVEREALIAAGLPLDGRAAWDVRERELFRSVVAAAGAIGTSGAAGATEATGVTGESGPTSSLTVSYSRLDAAGREVARSAFVEALEDVVGQPQTDELPVARVLTPGLPLCPPERLADAERVAHMERRRQAGHEFTGNGTIEDPALVAWLAERFGEERVWSPTQLEEFAKCPWAYFCGRVLRLEKKEDPDTELDPAVRGSILHDALRRFFDAAVARAGGPVLLDEDDLAWAGPALLQALGEALEAAGQEAWLGHPALRPARQQELRRTLGRYLQFEIEHTVALFNNRTNASWTLRTGVVAHERDFDGVELERAGVRFRIRGRIDRVEVGIDERVAGDVTRYVAAVDYKSSKYSTPGAGKPEAWEEGIVLQVPLYAHALAQIEPDAQVARVEYRTLKSPGIVHPLELAQVDRNAGEVFEPEEAAAKFEQALATAAQHVAAIRAGRFPASPAACADCAPWCVGRDICRVHERPREK